jgi:putative ATPase
MDNNHKPLADRMRPVNLNEFLGQTSIIAPGKLLEQAISSKKVPSLIFWGPPGSGKTTLALIIAKAVDGCFVQISAVSSGVKDLKEIIKQAELDLRLGKQTLLFVDEIHRWNKTQQDALLPFIERGTLTLIGATTENPSFEIRSALLSRCQVLVLQALSSDDISVLINRSIKDKERGLGEKKIKISKKNIELIASLSNGDARSALNALEYAASVRQEIDRGIILEAFQKSYLFYDKGGEEHYNIISALHKSMRGSDPNAALYWLFRMLEAGEDPLYIARRLIRFASEDVGLANSKALEQTVAAYQACHFIGMPECNVILAQAVVYLSKCEKSNDLYAASLAVIKDVQEFGNLPVPLHIRNAPTKLMKDLGYSKGYKYSPEYGYKEKQEYLPDKLKGKKYLKQK